MTDQPRTPAWWRALPSWSQATILALLLPGVVAHELTHALVAHPWGEWSLDWDAIACEVEWHSEHPAPRAASHIAPLVGGYALAVGAVAAVLGRPGITIHAGLLAYVSVNWLLFTVATVADLRLFLSALQAWKDGYRFRTVRDTE
jgi:hypothetical protein